MTDPLADLRELRRKKAADPLADLAELRGQGSSPQPDIQTAGRVRTPLLDRTELTGAEVKRRAAAGEPVLQKGEGLRPATAAQEIGADVAAGAGGLVAGALGAGAILVDAVTLPVRAAKAAIEGRPGRSTRGAIQDAATDLPLTRKAAAVGDTVEEKARGAFGIDKDVATEGDEAITRLAADIVAPGPEIVGAARRIGPKRVAGVVVNVPETVGRAEPVIAEEGARLSGGAEVNPPSVRNRPAKVGSSGTLRAEPSTVGEAVTRVREFVEDDWIRVKNLVRDPNVKVSAASDPYTAEILFHGRLGTRIEEAKEIVTKIDRDIVQTSRRAGVSPAVVGRDVDRFLQARHAPERNAAIGERAAGISDDEARAVLGELEASPHGAEVKRIADELQGLNNRTLDTLLEGEVITPELHATLRERYKHHVPLNRIMDDTDDVGPVLGGRPLDVTSSGIRRAKGSEREVSDITTNIVTNYEQALVRAEKNRVNLATLRFARDNPELGLFKEIKPKALGKSFDGESVILERLDDPQVLTMREAGKPVYLRIEDPNLSIALHGVGRHKVDGLLRFAQGFTRFFSTLATRFNPEFAFPNKIRDLQEASIYAFSKKEFGAAGAVKVAARDVASIRDVLDGVRGRNTEGARLYRQMRRDGGTTGGMGLSTRKQVELDVEKIRRMNRSAPRRAAQKFVELVDNWNTVFEDSTRLSVYRTALERGVTQEAAARLAKEASINFNKFGRGGPQINALYMFANASIQGSTKMLRAMKNPKVAGTVTTALAASVAAVSEWNDRIDPQWRDRVTKYDRLSSLPVVLPPSEDGSFNYFVIPVSWGIKPIKVAMDHAYDALSGHGRSPGDTAANVTAAAFEAYNPIGGTDMVSALTPTPIDLPVDLGRNQAWHGGKIKPDWDRTQPESEKFFSSLPNSATGRGAIAASEGLSSRGIEVSPADLKYAYETLIGGAGRAVSKVGNTISAIGQGEAPAVRDVPFASRFAKSATPDEVERREIAAERERQENALRKARRMTQP